MATVRRVADERGTTYVFVGTPDERRRREILRGSLVSRWSASCPGSTSASSPTAPTGRGSSAVTALVVVLVVLRGVLLAVGLLLVRQPPARQAVAAAARRILVPFTGGSLDPTVLDAAIRIAQRRGGRARPRLSAARPAPVRGGLTAPRRGAVAMPLLEAVEHAALRAGVPVDARIEKGRTPTHALSRLWDVEPFDRIVVPAPSGGHAGFTETELAWLLVHAPPETETLVLRPGRPAASRVKAGPLLARTIGSSSRR